MNSDSSPQKIRRIFIVVHGIGKQQRGATARGLAAALENHSASAVRSPTKAIGHYYSDEEEDKFSIIHSDSNQFSETLVTEFYWAHIAQEYATEKKCLEETKSWANTIVERLMFRHMELDSGEEKPDYSLTTEVLDELIDTVAVVEKIGRILPRFGLKEVKPRPVLDEFLGDVQLVTEFEPARKKINHEFDMMMNRIERKYFSSTDHLTEIHFITHSEGTVVTFLNLLKNAGKRPNSEDHTTRWIEAVKSFTTLGSPIDKHLMLWPELFEEHKPLLSSREEPIQWLNYYDKGDPVGFELDYAQNWLLKTGWASEKEQNSRLFGKIEENGFSRYFLPGKAHVDYWTDSELFSHYLARINYTSSGDTQSSEKIQPTLKDKWNGVWGSQIIPFLLSFLLFFLATGALYRATDLTTTHEQPSWGDMLLSIFGASVLLFGLTISVRMTRIGQSARWIIAGTLAFLLGVLSFASLVNIELVNHFEPVYEEIPSFNLFLASLLMSVVTVFAFYDAYKEDDAELSFWEKFKGVAKAHKRIISAGILGLSVLIILSIVPYLEGILNGKPFLREEFWTIRSEPCSGIFWLAASIALVGYIASLPEPFEQQLKLGSRNRMNRKFFKGMRPMLFVGVLAAFSLIILVVKNESFIPMNEAKEQTVELKVQHWGAFLSWLVAFFYLWWLGALIFDLSFVWIRYVRQNRAAQAIRKLCRPVI